MYRTLHSRLDRLHAAPEASCLRDSLVGLEKESLRASVLGGIAQTPHPPALGSALTHPYITTDYAEALLEFITPPCADRRQALEFLRDAHLFVYRHIGAETLWGTSMPCVLAGDASIRIGYYGESNAGRMKHVYRRGLGYRYGQTMQVIAGVHFNYSLPDRFWSLYQQLEGSAGALRAFKDAGYFAMIRNLQRFGWLIPYLFGASPAVCRSFFGDKPTPLPLFNESTYYEPYATSLRMGDIGYTNRKEGETGAKACYDDLDAYVTSLTHALTKTCPQYEKIGVVVDGQYRQLNANVLQIENEYYSTIRPKQLLQGNEKPTLALKRRGVQYVELRSLDVNAYEPLGISEQQLYFLEAFMLFCLLHDSPPLDREETREIDENQLATAHEGRDPELNLMCQGRPRPLREWAAELCDAMQGACELLDRFEPDNPFGRSLAAQRELVRDPEQTPSARMLAEMRHSSEGFYAFARRMSETHRRYFNSQSLSPEREQFFASLAAESIQQQHDIEVADDIDFEEYLARYFAQSIEEDIRTDVAYPHHL
ncbi:MAG: glutamate--cysteine ligase [Gammaproteobacteria bacterium SG8_47]|nr:MAG: glutamate--cysteine ligase [Gammaproteobacteria bacterium SG8_47]